MDSGLVVEPPNRDGPLDPLSAPDMQLAPDPGLALATPGPLARAARAPIQAPPPTQLTDNFLLTALGGGGGAQYRQLYSYRDIPFICRCKM